MDSPSPGGTAVIIPPVSKPVPKGDDSSGSKGGMRNKGLLAFGSLIIALVTFVSFNGASSTTFATVNIPLPPLIGGGSEGEGAATPKAASDPDDEPLCKRPTMLFGGKVRQLPTCKMPTLMANRVTVSHDVTAPDTFPEIMSKYPFSADFFRPPLKSKPWPYEIGKAFQPYNEEEWQIFCDNKLDDMIVPDKIVFFFIQDRGSWEMEPLVNHISPFLLDARMRDYYDVDTFTTVDEYKEYVANYDKKKTIMTVHISFEGEMNDPQFIAKSFVENVQCFIEHMRLWYTKKQVDKLLETAKGAIMVGEFFTSPLNFHRLLTLVDWFRSGKAKLDTETGLVTTRLTDKFTNTSDLPALPPHYDWEKHFPTAPIELPPNSPFVLPEITVTYGTSDEFLGNVPMNTYASQWRSLSPNRRFYLRQYAPKMMRDETAANTLPLLIEHVMSGFRHFGPEPISAEASISSNVSERRFLWSFLGDLKSDRREMNATFTDWQIKKFPLRPFYCCGGSESVRAMYSESIFVPVGRGHANLDCFRIYEAAGNGAIPVIVGSRQEVYDTFGHFITSKNRLPPFLFAETWENATMEVERLLGNHRELQQKHEDCVHWFFKNLFYMRKRIMGLP